VASASADTSEDEKRLSKTLKLKTEEKSRGNVKTPSCNEVHILMTSVGIPSAFDFDSHRVLPSENNSSSIEHSALKETVKIKGFEYDKMYLLYRLQPPNFSSERKQSGDTIYPETQNSSRSVSRGKF